MISDRSTSLARSLWTFPRHYRAHLLALLPLAISQVLQRLFHIVDNRFLGMISNEALLIHNVQYAFIVLGQFLGVGTATSALIFWRRHESANKQKSLLRLHLCAAGAVASFFALCFSLFSTEIVAHFGLPPAYLGLARLYLCIGLFNMLLQALFGTLDGFLTACGKQRVSLLLASVLLAGNILFDALAVAHFNSGGTLFQALLLVVGSTSLLFSVACFVAYRVVSAQAKGEAAFQTGEMFPIWRAEVGICFIRSLAPLVGAWQMARVLASPGFLVTHNMILHLAYVMCLPLAAASQIAVRDASSDQGKNWWPVLLHTALLPTLTVLLVASAMPGLLLKFAYGYDVPADHLAYLPIYLVACLVGQLGNVLAIPLRAAKLSRRITWNFAITELGVLIGGTALLIYLRIATPATVCWATFTFSVAYTVLNWRALDRLHRPSPGNWLLNLPALIRRGVLRGSVSFETKFLLLTCLASLRGVFWWLRGYFQFTGPARPVLVGSRTKFQMEAGACIEIVSATQKRIPRDEAQNPLLPRAASIGMPNHWRFLDHPAGRPTSLRLKPRSRLVMGDNIIICKGAYVSVWAEKTLVLEDNVYLGNDVLIATSLGLRIGKNTMIGLGTMIMDYDGHPIYQTDTPVSDPYGGMKAPIEIGENVWIGYHCQILKGVKIGRGSIVGSGSVVTHDVPPNSIVAGNPARVVKEHVTWRLW